MSIQGAAIPFQILRDHAPIISLIEGKEITIKSKEITRLYKLSSGVVQNKNNTIEILVDSAEEL